MTQTEPASVRQILEAALDRSLDGIPNPTRGEVDGWDSLVQVELLFMLEEEFDVRFSEDEIGRLNSLEGIVAMLDEKHAAA
jgi:acyl carrier protein